MEKTDTKQLLFDTALQLFRRYGCEQVTIQQICTAAGTTRNAFYYHYTSKEDLLCSYFQCKPISETDLFQDLLLLPDDWERLLYIYEIHSRVLIREGKDFVRQLSIACIKNRKSLFLHCDRASSYSIPLIEQCKGEGMIQSALPAETISYLARTLAAAAIREWCISEREYDIIPHIRMLITAALRPESI